MLWIARILADLIQQYIASVSQSAGEYRLVIPGLTPKIGEELHSALLSSGINSYLVISKDRIPNKEQRWLLPVSLTTMRIGSFVAVTDPGALSDVRDSIRGSGGTIRGTAFSEEWPWIEIGSEAFHFRKYFLPCLLTEWSHDNIVRDWLEMLIADVLLDCTRRDHERIVVFLEQILGAFDPRSPAGITDIRERFLLHCGIPRPANLGTDPNRLSKETKLLIRRIVNRVRTEPNLRNQVYDNIDNNAPNVSTIHAAVETFFDGLASTSALDGDILALRHCWGTSIDKIANWQCLTADLLSRLFEVQERLPIELSCTFEPAQSTLVSEDGRSAAAPSNADIIINVHHEIPATEFGDGHCRLALAIRNHIVTEQVIINPSDDIKLTLNIEDLKVSYRNRVSVKVSILIDGEIRNEDRIILHSYGQKRQAFVITTPYFWVDDADVVSEDDPSPERRYLVDRPVRLHLFSYEEIQPSLKLDDGSEALLVFKNSIWETAETFDVFGEPTGQTTCKCQFGERWVSLSFQAEDIDRGEFTLEDELRQLQVEVKKDRLGEVLKRYTGKINDAYSRLGGLTEQARRKIRFAKCFEDRDGWKPILADLLKPTAGTAESCGTFARKIDGSDASAIEAVALPDDALDTLRQYAEKRDAFRKVVLSTLNTSGIAFEHPEYAVFPVYLTEESSQGQDLEHMLSNYLAAYGRLQKYLLENSNRLDWEQIFILTYVDCLVQWRDDVSKNAFFLIGPWHPLVVAKRFLVQRALVMRAKRMIEQNDREFHELVGLLAQTSGFHWYPCLKADYAALEPAYVTPTSDPGWHLAFKRRVTESNRTGVLADLLEEYSRAIRDNLGLEAQVHLPSSGTMVGTVLSSYMRTFPSKRHVGVYFPVGFRGENEVVIADQFLHTEEGPTHAGLQFMGGLNLIFSDTPSIPEDVSWTKPPLRVFRYEDQKKCLEEQHPDIQFCQIGNRLSFLEMEDVPHLPRGEGYESVFSQSVARLTKGQDFVPQSISEEWDVELEGAVSIGELFISDCGLACKLCGKPHGMVHATSLPLRLETTWTVVPGTVIDPAVFVKYVMDGESSHIEERALWDYHISLSRSCTSFFVLSTIPSAFRSAVNGIFGTSKDLASEFVTELGQIGLAIAGEAMKSGRNALGTVGVVGAVRLFSGHGNNLGPLRRSHFSAGFILPVDSFRDILEGNATTLGQHNGDEIHRRADLLAILIRLPEEECGRMIIQTTSIECKFTTGTYPSAQVQSALDQAWATTEKFMFLCKKAQGPAGMPERLALLQLIQFGLRITGIHFQGDSSIQQEIERCISKNILCGNFEYRPAKATAVLVSTELSLPGTAEFSFLSTGLWIRLNQNHWPGVAETESLVQIRQVISDIFDFSDESPIKTGENTDKVITIPADPEVPSLPVTRGRDNPDSDTTFPTAPERPSLPTATGRDGPDSDTTLPTDPEALNLPTDSNAKSAQGVVLKAILVGVDSSRRSVYFDPHSPVDRLDNANVMITGSSGKGKTQLLKYLITAIRDQGANTLVLDFKNDFASDSHFVDRAKLAPVLVAFDGLPFNPLIPYPIKNPRDGRVLIQCAQHITGITSVLRRTYSLGAQQEAAVKNAIRKAFSEAGIDPNTMDVSECVLSFPDLARVGEILEQTNAAAYNRLDPLFTLGLFKTEYSRISFDAMVNRSSAIDFSQIPSDPLKNALAELVILSAHAYFNSQPHCGTLRQVFVVDEAHRVLSADYLERFALECRAYGLSLLLSSQYPSHFPHGISSSMATKIIHGNDRDVDRVRDIVNLLGCTGSEAQIADLGMFEAFFSNKHSRNVNLRTITYPISLILAALRSSGTMSHNEIAHIDGIDIDKLSVGNLVRQLERLGLCESINDKVRFIPHGE